MPDMETINRYWGSMEAYREEQRRTALLGLEEQDATVVSNWNWDVSRRLRRPRTQDQGNKRPGVRSFHLFGRNN